MWWIVVRKTHDNLLNPDVYFFAIYVTVLCEPICNPDKPKSIKHIRLYVSVDCMHDIFSFHYFFIFYFISLVSTENYLRYLDIYDTKNMPPKSRDFKIYFSVNHVRGFA